MTKWEIRVPWEHSDLTSEVTQVATNIGLRWNLMSATVEGCVVEIFLPTAADAALLGQSTPFASLNREGCITKHP